MIGGILRRALSAGRLVTLGALCVAGGRLDAQVASASVALGVVQVRFAGNPAFTSTTLTPAFALRARHLALAAQATFAQLGTAGWSTQGNAQASLFTGVSSRGLMLEAAGAMGGSSYPGGTSTAQGLGALRAHWLGVSRAAWVGAAMGRMNDGVEWRGVQQGELGVTLSGQLQRFTVIATPSITDETLKYTDVLAVLSTGAGALDVSLSLGARSGAKLPFEGGEQRVWGGASLQLWLARSTSFLVGFGTYPVDATQGFPAGRFVSFGLRLGERRSASALAQSGARRTIALARESGLREFSLRAADDATLALRVRAPHARSVEVTGDFTGWRPLALARGDDGWWWARVPNRGVQTIEMTLRVDGGAWVVPPGAETVRDEFGGVSGRVLVSGGM